MVSVAKRLRQEVIHAARLRDLVVGFLDLGVELVGKLCGKGEPSV